MLKTISSAIILVSLVACGGGGSSGSSTSNVNIAYEFQNQNYSTSYENLKKYPINHLTLPTETYPNFADGPLAITAGKFSVNTIEVFTASIEYTWSGSNAPSQSTVLTNPQIYNSRFVFWKVNNDGTLTKRKEITDRTQSCLHPRKAIAADFDTDGIDDIFVACTGYDGGTFPGEYSKLLLSSLNFVPQNLGDSNAYTHGASAADVTGDNAPDLVITNNKDSTNPVKMFVNNGVGSLTADTSKINTYAFNSATGFYSAELVDVDSNGSIDLFIGGHEYQNAQTQILFKRLDATFGPIDSSEAFTYRKILTAVVGSGVVLDITVNNSYLYVDRATDGTNGTSFYSARTLQKINVNNYSASLIFEKVSGQWIAWWQWVDNSLKPVYGRFGLNVQ